MRQGFTLLWMGWQWDVPEGRMRMEIPIATDNGQPITGWCAATSFPAPTRRRALDRRPRAPGRIPVVDPDERRTSAAACARCRPIRRARSSRAHAGASPAPARSRSIGGFEPGRIYDVVYRARDPRVVGVGLAGTRDLVSFFKHATAAAGQSDARASRRAIGWGVSQTGRFLRHFVYQGFNEDERGAQRLRRRVRSGRRRRPRLVQPPLRPAVARSAAALQHPVSRWTCSRSPTPTRPIRRPASPTACWRGRRAATPCRSSSTC